MVRIGPAAVSQLMSRTLRKATAKQPLHRFSGTREFGEVLKKALRNEPIECFDSSRIQPRIDRAKKAQGEGDYQFALDILNELEAEGHLDPQIPMLRIKLDQTIQQKPVSRLLENVRTRMQEEKYPLALQKIPGDLGSRFAAGGRSAAEGGNRETSKREAD
jgi:hypothetical protein